MNAASIANEFAQDASRFGLQFEVDGKILRIRSTFEPGDIATFTRVLHDSHYALSKVPKTRPGSVWGGDGVGAHVAIKHGRLEVCASGLSLHVLSRLHKTCLAESVR